MRIRDWSSDVCSSDLVQDEKRMFGIERHRFAGVRLPIHDVVQPDIASFFPVDLPTRALVYDDITHGLALAHGKGIIYRRLARDALAAAYLFVGRKDQFGANVPNTFGHLICGKPTKPHDVDTYKTRPGHTAHHLQYVHS